MQRVVDDPALLGSWSFSHFVLPSFPTVFLMHLVRQHDHLFVTFRQGFPSSHLTHIFLSLEFTCRWEQSDSLLSQFVRPVFLGSDLMYLSLWSLLYLSNARPLSLVFLFSQNSLCRLYSSLCLSVEHISTAYTHTCTYACTYTRACRRVSELHPAANDKKNLSKWPSSNISPSRADANEVSKRHDQVQQTNNKKRSLSLSLDSVFLAHPFFFASLSLSLSLSPSLGRGMKGPGRGRVKGTTALL